MNEQGIRREDVELLAPAGDWDCMRAAVANGADAVFFGVEKFNARARANNFRMDELPEIMAFLHSYGVKGFLTFNILVFENELAIGLPTFDRLMLKRHLCPRRQRLKESFEQQDLQLFRDFIESSVNVSLTSS